MSGHDAASVVGQMAGLGDQQKQGPITPAQLIERFCTNVEPGLVADAGVKPGENGVTQIARGHCGYMGGHGDDFATGFDDGYDFMGYLDEHGWSALAGKGEWPYVVYMSYKPRDPYAIACYCEGDLTVWTFENGEAAQAFYRTLKDAP